ncbi:MAG: ABC transporter ATP-binding protein, partial [Planctomycetota bacterium]
MISRQSDAIDVRDLRKAFRSDGGRHVALDGVTFQLRRGERLAYLGPNGAGKTTMIRCLCGRTKPDSGTVTLLGHTVRRGTPRPEIGLVPQEIAVYADLTTKENLRALGRFHGLTGRRLRQRVDWALQWTGLYDRSDDLVGT